MLLAINARPTNAVVGIAKSGLRSPDNGRTNLGSSDVDFAMAASLGAAKQ
jgi:hypothetical protein